MNTAPDLDEVVETFAFLDDWEERYKYIIDLGKALPPLRPDQMTDIYKVRGCQSQVWLVSEMKDGTLTLEGDSDAFIVKGLVALLLIIFNGKKPSEILAIDAKKILTDLDLEAHLSPMRANGLYAMLQRIEKLAREESAPAA